MIGVYCVPYLCTQGVSSKRLDVAEVSGENRVPAGALVSSRILSSGRSGSAREILRELPSLAYVGLFSGIEVPSLLGFDRQIHYR